MKLKELTNRHETSEDVFVEAYTVRAGLQGKNSNGGNIEQRV